MILSQNTAAYVVMPENASLRERFAADELRKYIKKSLNIELVESVDVVSNANYFIIGGPGSNKAAADLISKAEFDTLLTGAEGMLIDIKGNTVLIAGSEGDWNDEQRGTIYAVYEFLERYLGCSFAAYGKPGVNVGETVPIYEQLELKEDRYYKAGADCSYRTAIIQWGAATDEVDHKLALPFIDWMTKNRYNRIMAWSSIYQTFKSLGLLAELEKRGIRLSVGHHESLRLFMPFYGSDEFPEHYGETHPEWYRLNADGTRFRQKANTTFDSFGGQMIHCSRNMEWIEAISNNIITWLGNNPLVDIVTLWPRDGIEEQCCCEECSKYSKVENYVFYENEIAKRVKAVYPNVKIDMIVYLDLWNAPDGLELDESIMIDQAAWGQDPDDPDGYEGRRLCGKSDGSGIIGTSFDRNIVKWKKTGADTVYYDYYMGVYANRQRIIPMADELQNIWQHFVEEKISGSGTQIECFDIWNHVMNFYSFARTGYDVSLSFEDNLQAMCRIFGEGADDVARAIRMMEAVLEGQVDIKLGGKYMIEHVDKETIYELFEHALTVTRDPLCRNNIRMIRMAFRYTDLDTAVGGGFVERDTLCEDPTGELAYMATNYDSMFRNNPGWGISIMATNTDTKGFEPDRWYDFE